MTTDKIIFGAGCFWGVEAAFRRVNGVVRATCGYAGGHTDYPTYETVCTHATGHIEVVLVEYDPTVVNLETLLDHFWNCHDPTTWDRQGPDVGPQYRSVIFFFSEEQAKAAHTSLQREEQSGYWQNPIVTKILPAPQFHVAEDYHQNYFHKHGIL